MIRNKCLTLIGMGLFFATMSCTDGYEPEPVEKFTIDIVFSKTDSAGVQATRFLNNIYSHIANGHNRVGGDYLDAASDDAVSGEVNDPDVYKLAMGRYTTTASVGSDMIWGDYYKGIRKVNIFINNIDVVPFNIKYKNAKGEVHPLNVTMKAEARFVRAYLYFELVKRYGGVPLMGDVVHVLGDNMELPRNTFADCIDYIVNELDAIKDDLRTNPMEDAASFAHAATREACMAMKSRVLLYAASPLFNKEPLEAGNELVGYASYDSKRWDKAAKAAKAFIDEYGEAGKKTYGLTSKFTDVFLDFYDISNNPEVIFCRLRGTGKDIETNNGPLGFTGNSLGNGRTNPTQNLVDAFPMKDGKYPGDKKFPGGSVYSMETAKGPYVDRDPRLDYTVLHHGSFWLNKYLDTSLNGTNNPTNSAKYTKTSYYMRKFMGAFENENEYSNKKHFWVLYRYAEILLNYAEAENENLASPSDDVYNAIIALRKRAGIEEGSDKLYGLVKPMTQAQMRQVIQNERRIEMAFEEQRYWDIRRWKLANNIFKTPLKGLAIVTVIGTAPTYNEVDVLQTTFDAKRYLYPISYSEIMKNENMIQNPKW